MYSTERGTHVPNGLQPCSALVSGEHRNLPDRLDVDKCIIETMLPEPVIVIDPTVMNGAPCFRGTRVPFQNLIDYLEGGESLGDFVRQFPTVTREMAVQALEEAKDSLLARIA